MPGRKPPPFAVGRTVRELRSAMTPKGDASISAVAGDCAMSYTRLQRLETASENHDRWLDDLERVARRLGLTLCQLIEASRVVEY